MPEEIINALQYPASMADTDLPTTTVKSNFAESTIITSSTIGCALAILAAGFAVQLAHGFYQAKALLALVAAIVFCALAIAGPQVTVILPFRRRAVVSRIFVISLVTYLLLGLAWLRTHHDAIDVLVFENDGVHALLHGQNTYSSNVTHENIPGSVYGPGIVIDGRVHAGFPYPPLTLLWALPGYAAGDVRYSFLVAVILAAILIFYLAPNLNGLLAAVFLLVAPETLFVLTTGWTEPLVVVTLAATIVCARNFRRLLPLAFGLFLASKQYSVLAVPLAALLLPRFSWKQYIMLLAKAGAVAAVVTVPFAVSDPRSFWWNLVTFRVVTPFRPDALSFSSLLFRHALSPIPEWFVLVVVLVATIFAVKWAPNTASGFAAALALISLIFFILNKQAYCNYYFFSVGALCLSMASADVDRSAASFALVKLPSPGPVGTVITTTP